MSNSVGQNNNNAPYRPAVVSNLPSTANPNEYNMLAADEEQVRKQADGVLTRIVAVDTVMRKSVSLVIDVFHVQLEVVDALLSQQPDERNFENASRQLGSKMAELREDNFQNYCSLLEARQSIMEDGVEVPLIREKKEALKQVWLEVINKILVDLGKIDITPDTNLEHLKAHLEELKSIKFEAYHQMMESKTSLTNQLFQLQRHAHDLFKVRERWLQSEAKDLWDASATGNLELLQACIKKTGMFSKKEEVNVLNQQGFAPVHLAAFNNQLEALQMLLSNKADSCLPDCLGYQPLHWAAKRGFVPIAEALIASEALVNARGEYGRTPLHMAVFNRRPEMVVFLLGSGAQINAQTSEEDASKTPLLDAVILGDLKIVTTLVKRNDLDVMICDRMGLSPLCHAVLDGHVEIASLIIGHESWKSVKDPKNPNHRDNLLKLKPRQNVEAMKELISTLAE